MFKKLIVTIRAIVFFLFFLLLSNSISSSNTSDPFQIYAFFGTWDGSHEQIVQNAFEEFKIKGGITQSVIDDLIYGVRYPDPEDIFEGIETIIYVIFPFLAPEPDPAAHWTTSTGSDDDIWDASAGRIRRRISAAIGASYYGNYPGTRIFLGEAFHTVADFFAHTNWVEAKGRSIEGLVFEEGKRPKDEDFGEHGWLTIKTGAEDKDTSDKAGYDIAFADAIAMTRKEFHNFEKQLFNTYPASASTLIKDFLGVDHPLLWIIWIWDPTEGHWPSISLGSTRRIPWEHCGINPNSRVKISLLKNGVWVGDIGEATLDERRYDWTVGDYYTINGGVKEWHTAEASDWAGSFPYYKIKITSLDTNIETVSHTFLFDSGEVTPGPPAAPRYLRAEFSWSSYEVMLIWGDWSNNEQEFIIERKSEWEPSWQEIGRLGPNGRWYNDPDVIGGTFYWYRVRAYNSYGYSDYSNEVQIYVPWY